MSQQVDGDHTVAALGERAGERLVHALGEQEAVDEDAGARALAVLGVDDPLALVAEGAIAARRIPLHHADSLSGTFPGIRTISLAHSATSGR